VSQGPLVPVVIPAYSVEVTVESPIESVFSYATSGPELIALKHAPADGRLREDLRPCPAVRAPVLSAERSVETVRQHVLESMQKDLPALAAAL